MKTDVTSFQVRRNPKGLRMLVRGLFERNIFSNNPTVSRSQKLITSADDM